MQRPLYETIGEGYARHRRADPRIVQLLVAHLALAPGSVLLELGAGTGNYSRALAREGYQVLALEPAAKMRGQAAPSPAVRWIAGVAEQIPLRAASVAGALCMLSVHHFRALERACAEVRRVCPRGPLLIFTFDPRCSADWWFPAYFPSVWAQSYVVFPPLPELAARCARILGCAVESVAFPLPPDLCDAFAAAGWRRPALYLDPAVRAGMSAFALADGPEIARNVERLRQDLASGAWRACHGAILDQATYDVGYRLLVLR